MQTECLLLETRLSNLWYKHIITCNEIVLNKHLLHNIWLSENVGYKICTIFLLKQNTNLLGVYIPSLYSYFSEVKDVSR
jgi:hypothetical protein